jgi:multidrug efflux system membrane fusion protein
MHFEPGTFVQDGGLLFVIDREVYDVAAQAAGADLTQAEAALELANVTLERMRQAGTSVSKAQVDEAVAEARAATAEVELRQAQLRQAEIDLGYTEVKAPIAGRVGRNRVDVGNLVGEGDATVLTEITAYDPMYAYFNLNERDLLRVMAMYRERIEEKGLDPEKDTAYEAGIAVSIGLADEEGYPGPRWGRCRPRGTRAIARECSAGPGGAPAACRRRDRARSRPARRRGCRAGSPR